MALCISYKCFAKGSLDLGGVDILQPALTRHSSILFCNGAFGYDQGTKGVEAQEEVAGHAVCMSRRCFWLVGLVGLSSVSLG